MVERYSWRRKDLVALQKRLMDEGYEVSRGSYRDLDREGRLITQMSNSLTVKSNNLRGFFNPTEGTVALAGELSGNELTPKDEKLFQLYRSEYRHTMSPSDAKFYGVVGGLLIFAVLGNYIAHVLIGR